jgi:hypothetical protein
MAIPPVVLWKGRGGRRRVMSDNHRDLLVTVAISMSPAVLRGTSRAGVAGKEA